MRTQVASTCTVSSLLGTNRRFLRAKESQTNNPPFWGTPILESGHSQKIVQKNGSRKNWGGGGGPLGRLMTGPIPVVSPRNLGHSTNESDLFCKALQPREKTTQNTTLPKRT